MVAVERSGALCAEPAGGGVAGERRMKPLVDEIRDGCLMLALMLLVIGGVSAFVIWYLLNLEIM